MNILFYDTETDCLVNRSAEYHHDSQPVALQIGAMLYNTDLERPLHKFTAILDWPGVQIDEGAAKVHGITPEIMSMGMEQNAALLTFKHMAMKADQFIGFNAGFDRIVMCSSFYRAMASHVAASLWEKPHFDIMKPLTNVCKIPGKYGYKWPKLSEAYRLLINPKGFDGAHDAMADIMATFELWKWCNDNNVKPEPVLY